MPKAKHEESYNQELFAKHVRVAMADQKISNGTIIKETGIKRHYVSLVRSGKKVSAGVLLMICNYLELNPLHYINKKDQK